MNTKLYLCGSINGTPECFEWRSYVRTQLQGLPCEVLDPCRSKLPQELQDDGIDAPGTIYAAGNYVGRDLWDIRRSDILLLHWWGDPGRQSIGTWVELGYAKACGKAIVVVDSTPSYQAVRHPFVYRNADAVFDDLDMGLDYIRYLLD